MRWCCFAFQFDRQSTSNLKSSRFSEATNKCPSHLARTLVILLARAEMYRTSSSNVGSGVARLSQSQRGESPVPDSEEAPTRRMALADFSSPLVTIAKGSFGTVYKAVRKDNGRVYALKQVEISNMNRAEREEAVDEVRSSKRRTARGGSGGHVPHHRFPSRHSRRSFPR